MSPTKEERLRGSILGGQITKERCAAETAVKKAGYTLSPKLCVNCQDAIPFEKRENKFCDKSCAASYNNKGKAKNKSGINGLIQLPTYCIVCGESLPKHDGHIRKYCANCSPMNSWEIQKQKFTEAGCVFGKAQSTLAGYVRRYLNETREHICVLCKNTEWQGKPIPLVSDHIDGNPHNHQLDNLRLICNNCNALLPTYKSKNIGNGRNFRYNVKENTS
jgi:predicted nucleic acid-binding Zn ribbon protein